MEKEEKLGISFGRWNVCVDGKAVRVRIRWYRNWWSPFYRAYPRTEGCYIPLRKQGVV